MADINTVLKAWECCDPFNRRCFECPYEDDCFHDGFDSVAIADMVKLMKDQQAEIKRIKGEGKPPTWKKGKAFCGNCGGCLENKEMFSSYHVSSIRFCKWCGVPVGWSNE